MTFVLHPGQLFFLFLSGCGNRQQQEVSEIRKPGNQDFDTLAQVLLGAIDIVHRAQFARDLAQSYDGILYLYTGSSRQELSLA